MSRLLLVAVAALFLTHSANAQLARSALEIYEEGTVWHMIKIRTKSGMRERYLDALSGTWKRQVEFAENMGFVIRHHVLVKWPSDADDWDVMIIEEFPNMAAYDAFWENWAKVDAEILPDPNDEAQAMSDIGEVRSLLGVEIAREVSLIAPGERPRQD